MPKKGECKRDGHSKQESATERALKDDTIRYTYAILGSSARFSIGQFSGLPRLSSQSCVCLLWCLLELALLVDLAVTRLLFL